VKLSVIIPVFNEKETVAEIIARVKAADIDGLEKEVIVVDDGSSDGTSRILAGIPGIRLVTLERNRGKGYAVRAGFREATGDILLIQDADLEYDPDQYARLIKPLLDGTHRVVYGSRYISRAQKKQVNTRAHNKHHNAYYLFTLGGRLVTWITNLLYGASLTDEPTCYKVFSADVVRSIDLRGNRFEWEPEITAKILKKGIRIHEVPISYNPRSISEGKKIGWIDGLQAVWTLVRYRFTS
jgi:glycosyltransferase involved in cell wall biosynthesis